MNAEDVVPGMVVLYQGKRGSVRFLWKDLAWLAVCVCPQDIGWRASCRFQDWPLNMVKPYGHQTSNQISPDGLHGDYPSPAGGTM